MSDTDEHGNGTIHSDGHSNSHSGSAFKRRTDYDPTDPVQVRVLARSRDRFDGWFASQYPGVRQPPAKDPWIDRVFNLGLDQIEKLMPPALSPEDRLAAAMADGS